MDSSSGGGGAVPSSGAGQVPNTVEEANRSFEGFEDEEEREDALVFGEGGGEGGRRRIFSKELRCMLYGYGDDRNPYTETVDFLEDLVMEFITEMTHK